MVQWSTEVLHATLIESLRLNLAINNNEWSSGIIINDDDKIQFSLNHLRAPPLKEGKEPIHQLSPTQKY